MQHHSERQTCIYTYRDARYDTGPHIKVTNNKHAHSHASTAPYTQRERETHTIKMNLMGIGNEAQRMRRTVVATIANAVSFSFTFLPQRHHWEHSKQEVRTGSERVKKKT